MKNQATRTLGIVFSAMAPTVAAQLKKQGYKYEKETVKYFDKESEAITRLRLSRLITDDMAAQANAKLYKNIQAHVIKINKLKLKKQAQ